MRAQRIVMVEASPGQLENELRLALSHANVLPPPIDAVRRMGGHLPQQQEIVTRIMASAHARAHVDKGVLA